MDVLKNTVSDYEVIGSTEYVEVAGCKNLPAKIDTGADSSAIWASNIKMDEDGVLTFTLFAEKSPYYTGETIKTTEYQVKSIRSSHGDKQIRYHVKLPLTLGGQTFDTYFSLANRSRNHFPILIGRRTISKKYLVDVSKSAVKRPKPERTHRLNDEMKKDPYEFYQKYMKQGK